MSSSAIASSEKIQKGFSLITMSSRIDWGLLVEGHTDALFYEKYKNNLTVFYGEPEKGESSMIPKIVKSKVDIGKNIYGIIDADYEAKTIDSKYQNNLIITDAHSLETMLIKHYDIEPFEKNVIKKLDFKFSFPNYKDKEKETVQKSLQWAYKIGVIREFKQLNSENINFKDVKKNSINYLRFLSIKQNDLDFDFELYLDELFNKNPNLTSKYTKKFFMKLVTQKESSYSYEEAWRLCHGHDVMNFIESSKLFYSFIGEPAKRLSFEKRFIQERTGEVTLYANDVIKKCKTSFFDGSSLSIWFENINRIYQ